MRLINNKYKVVNTIKATTILSEYIARDIEDSKIYKMSIFKEDNNKNNVKEYIVNNIQAFINFNFDGVLKTYKLINIRDIDGINIEMGQSAIITEYAQDILSLEEYFQIISDEKILIELIKIGTNLSTLNIKGLVFNSLDIKDIKVIRENKKYQVKLPNVLCSEIENIDLFQFEYDSTDILSGSIRIADKKSNLKEYIEILDRVLSKKELKNKDMKKLYNIVHGVGNLDNITCIRDFIQFINYKLEKTFPRFLYKTLNKIEKDIDIIGRGIEVENIKKIYKDIVSKREDSKFVIFKGSLGVGKTKLLRTIKERLEFTYDAGIISFIEDKNLLDINSAIDNGIYEKTIIKDLKDFILDLSNSIKNFTENSIRFKEVYKIISLGIKSVEAYIKIKPIVFIIDGADLNNKVLRLFLSQLIGKIESSENMLLIASLDDSDYYKKIRNDYKELLFKGTLKEYKVDLLNEYYSNISIKKLLSTSFDLDNLQKIILKESLGNPELINRKLNYIYENKSLRISGKTGQWEYIGDEKTLRKASNEIEKKYEEKIVGLTYHEHNILKKIAIYEFVVNEDFLLNKIVYSEEEKSAYQKLKKENILAESYDDNGINIEFKDYFYKKIIYKNINKKLKESHHVKFSKVLESSFEEERKYFDELMYHLEKSGNTKKIVYYGKKFCDKALNESDYEKALKGYNRIFIYSERKEKMYIALTMGEIYTKINKIDDGIKYYKIANEIATEFLEHRVIVDSLLNLAQIYIERGSYDKGIRYISIAKLSLFKIDYREGELFRFYLLALYYKFKGNIRTSINYIEKSLPLCRDLNCELLIAKIYLVFIEYKIKDREFNYIINEIAYCIRVFNNNSNRSYYYEANILKAVVLLEKDNRINDSGRILKTILKRSLTENFPVVQFKALIYLAIVEIYNGKLDSSKKYLLNALNISKNSIVLDTYLDVIYKNLMYIAVIEGEINEAIKYKNILLKKNKENGLIVKALYYYLLDDYDKFYKMISDLGERKNDLEALIENRYFKIYYEIMSLALIKDSEFLEFKALGIIRNVEEFNKNLSYKTRIVVDLIILIKNIGNLKLAIKIFNRVSDRIDIKLLDECRYLKVNWYFRRLNSNNLINQALRNLSNLSDSKQKIILYYIVGEIYEKKKVYILALEYYYEAISIIVKYIRFETDSRERLEIVNSRLFKGAIERFKFCANDKLKLKIEINSKANTIDRIDKIIEQLRITSLISNRKFKRILSQRYEEIYYNSYKGIEQCTEEFSQDILHNIEVIIKYLARVTMATGAILTLDNGKTSNIIYSYRNQGFKGIEDMFKKKINTDSLVLTSSDMSLNGIYDTILPKNLKALMYIKLNEDENVGDTKVVSKGEIILLSDKVINNINDESKQVVKKYKKMILFLLDQYKLNLDSTRDKLTGAYNRGYFD